MSIEIDTNLQDTVEPPHAREHLLRAASDLTSRHTTPLQTSGRQVPSPEDRAEFSLGASSTRRRLGLGCVAAPEGTVRVKKLYER